MLVLYPIYILYRPKGPVLGDMPGEQTELEEGTRHRLGCETARNALLEA